MLVLRVRRLALTLILIALFFVPLSVYRTPIRQFVEVQVPYSLEVDRLLTIGGVGSLAGWYFTLLFLAGAAVLLLVARHQERGPERPNATLPAAMAVLLALDQTVLLRNRLLDTWLRYVSFPDWIAVAVALALFGLLWWAGRQWDVQARRLYRLAWVLIFAGYIWGVVMALHFPQDRAHEVASALLTALGAVSLLAAALLQLAVSAPHLHLTFHSGAPLSLMLAGVAVVFTLATLGFYALDAQTDLSVVDPLRWLNLLDSGQEATIPTFYSVSIWLLCAALLALISVGERDEGRRDQRRWWALAALFVFLSLDEAASLHEQLIGVSRALVSKLSIEHGGLLYYGWVLPVGLLVLLLFVLYIPFFRRLPRHTAVWMLVSGALFVTGALGLELVGGMLVSGGDDNNALTLTVAAVEELLEMLGLAGFIYALVDYLAAHVAPVAVRVIPNAPAPAPDRVQRPT